MLLDDIKKDLKQAMIDKNDGMKDALRMVIGEVPRLNKKAGELPTDEEVCKIIKSLIKSEEIILEASGIHPSHSNYIKVLSKYLPVEMNKEEIQAWIVDNIDLNQFNPKIKAMSVIMKDLKDKANGGLVRQVLMEM